MPGTAAAVTRHPPFLRDFILFFNGGLSGFIVKKIFNYLRYLCKELYSGNLCTFPDLFFRHIITFFFEPIIGIS